MLCRVYDSSISHFPVMCCDYVGTLIRTSRVQDGFVASANSGVSGDFFSLDSSYGSLLEIDFTLDGMSYTYLVLDFFFWEIKQGNCTHNPNTEHDLYGTICLQLPFNITCPTNITTIYIYTV